ncbi:MAG: hypothetical protein QW303_03735 [Nitrososphaerota archaeon]
MPKPDGDSPAKPPKKEKLHANLQQERVRKKDLPVAPAPKQAVDKEFYSLD